MKTEEMREPMTGIHRARNKRGTPVILTEKTPLTPNGQAKEAPGME